MRAAHLYHFFDDGPVAAGAVHKNVYLFRARNGIKKRLKYCNVRGINPGARVRETNHISDHSVLSAMPICQQLFNISNELLALVKLILDDVEFIKNSQKFRRRLEFQLRINWRR